MLKFEGHVELAVPLTGPGIAGPVHHWSLQEICSIPSLFRRDSPTPHHGGGRAGP